MSTTSHTVDFRRRSMGRKQRRLMLIGVAGLVLVTAVALILTAMSSRITFFNSPTDILANPPAPTQRIRLGGLVAIDSVTHGVDGLVTFQVTDGSALVPVTFRGNLPDLFFEGQGVIAEGTLGSGGVFQADSLLAKHDEAYIPAEVVDALKAQGVWEGAPPATP